MSEKINFNFAPSTQTTDEAILEQKAAELRMDRALGKDIDESELQAVKDMQNVFANRQPAGSYNEYIDIKEKNPLEVGLFPGDVFYKKEVKKTKAINPDGTPKYTFKEGSQHAKIRETNEEVLSEKVYSITARRVENGTVFVTLVIAKNTESGVDETQLLTEDEARKVLANAELVDSGMDRENADTISAGSVAVKGEVAEMSEDGGDNAQEEILTEEDERYAQIYADASSLDRVQMLNAAYGNNKPLDLTEAGTEVLKDLDNAKGKKAAEIVRLALENGFVLSNDFDKKPSSDTDEVNESPATGKNETNETDKTTEVDNGDDENSKTTTSHEAENGFDPSSLSSEATKQRKADATKTYRQLTDAQLERLLRTVYGDAAFDDESQGTREQKLEGSRNINDDEAAEIFLNGVDEKHFRLEVDNEAPQNTPQSNHPELGTLPGSFGEQQTQVIDLDEASVQNRRWRGGLNRLKSVMDRSKSLSRKDKFRYGLGAAFMVMSGIATYMLVSKHGGPGAEEIAQIAQSAKDATKSKLSVGPLGAPGAMKQSADHVMAALEQVPVRDGSGGYELLNTLNQTLHADIPKEIWDQHQYEFAANFKDYVVAGPHGEIWLKDIDPNSGISHYDLTKMKDVIASWTQSR